MTNKINKGTSLSEKSTKSDSMNEIRSRKERVRKKWNRFKKVMSF